MVQLYRPPPNGSDYQPRKYQPKSVFQVDVVNLAYMVRIHRTSLITSNRVESEECPGWLARVRSVF